MVRPLRIRVATPEGADAIVAAVIDRFGRLDGLVNNAGIIRIGGFEETPAGQYRQHLDVRCMDTVLVTAPGAETAHIEGDDDGRQNG